MTVGPAEAQRPRSRWTRSLQARAAQEQVRQGLRQRAPSTEAGGGMGLTQKILLFTSAADRGAGGRDPGLHHRAGRPPGPRHIREGLAETRAAWEAFQADRFNKLRLGVRVLGERPALQGRARRGGDQATVARHAARAGARPRPRTSSWPPTPRAGCVARADGRSGRGRTSRRSAGERRARGRGAGARCGGRGTASTTPSRPR